MPIGRRISVCYRKRLVFGAFASPEGESARNFLRRIDGCIER
jgi:hypothetical protein